MPENSDAAGEDEQERLDRELIELLNELRVALPGIQVLFAFLLIVPFSQGWRDVTGVQRDVYFAAVVCTTIATVLLIAPTALHRIQWRARDKEWMLTASNRFAIAGTAFLGLATAAVVFLITDVVFGGWAVAVTTGLTAALIAGFWFVLPLARRLQS
ncbi:MAG: hypothetical protein ICV74_09800 [Thermoleophilia bacterium]|nr:hypothetical protein [Thermoleophilia bacterium]